MIVEALHVLLVYHNFYHFWVQPNPQKLFVDTRILWDWVEAFHILSANMGLNLDLCGRLDQKTQVMSMPAS